MDLPSFLVEEKSMAFELQNVFLEFSGWELNVKGERRAAENLR